MDLFLLGAVFWSVWSLRFVGFEFIGALTMGVCILVALLLQHWNAHRTPRTRETASGYGIS